MQKKNKRPNWDIEEMSNSEIISVNRRQGSRMFRINLPRVSAVGLFRIYVLSTSSRVAIMPATTMTITTIVPSSATSAESLTMDIIECGPVRALWVTLGKNQPIEAVFSVD